MSKPRLFECKGCRKRREIVFSRKGMSYCEGCAHKAPDAKAYINFMFPQERNHKPPYGSNSARKKELEPVR